MFSRWLVLLLDRRDERRFLIFCYARRTLVGRSKTKVDLKKGTREEMLLPQEQRRMIKSKEFKCLRSKAKCLWTQENARLHRSKIEITVHVAGYLEQETHKRRKL